MLRNIIGNLQKQLRNQYYIFKKPCGYIHDVSPIAGVYLNTILFFWGNTSRVKSLASRFNVVNDKHKFLKKKHLKKKGSAHNCVEVI